MRIAVAVSASLLLLGACGDDPVDPSTLQRVFGDDRPIELQIPRDFADGEQYPLIILLHGYGASGLLQTAYLQLANIPEDPGAFFMAPEGTKDGTGRQFWNASAACCGEGTVPVDDVAYLGGLIDDVSAIWPVDPSQVFLIGHSNGSFMAYRMACERADVVTAIAGLAGAAFTVDGSDCDPAEPVSVLHVHGTADAVVAYAGGNFEGGAYPGAVESVSQWQDKDGCGAARTTGESIDLERDLDGAETTVEIADDCDAGLGIELWSMTGAGHIPDLDPSFGPRVLDWLGAHARQ